MHDSHKTTLTPSAGMVVERKPVKCHRCGKTFDGLVFEEIQGITQLRCGGLLIRSQFANCIRCGCPFNWNVHEKDVEKMALVYGQLLNAYVPE